METESCEEEPQHTLRIRDKQKHDLEENKLCVESSSTSNSEEFLKSGVVTKTEVEVKSEDFTDYSQQTLEKQNKPNFSNTGTQGDSIANTRMVMKTEVKVEPADMDENSSLAATENKSCTCKKSEVQLGSSSPKNSSILLNQETDEADVKPDIDLSSNSSEDCSVVTNQGLGRTSVKLETGDNPGADGSCVKQEVENGNVSSTIPACVLVKLEIDTYKDIESPQPTLDPLCNEFEKSVVSSVTAKICSTAIDREGDENGDDTLTDSAKKFHTSCKDSTTIRRLNVRTKAFVCKKVCVKLFRVTQHRVVLDSEKPHVCDVCCKAFTSARNLKLHRRIHTTDLGQVCQPSVTERTSVQKSISKKAYIKLFPLKYHKLLLDGRRFYVCDVCDKAFTKHSTLKAHKWIHAIEKPHVCDQCGKTFAFSNSLKRHKLIHSGEKSFACEQCEKTFRQRFPLKLHKMVHASQKPHVCDTCNKGFSNINALRQHKLIHTAKKPHVCDVCEKTFRRLAHLQQHKVIHSAQKPHVCNVCSKGFTLTFHLKQHKLIHTGEKPYACDECDKTFRHCVTLKRHKLIHRGEKPHVCAVCKKSFTTASNLKEHQLIHTGEKPHVCAVCDQTFRHYVSLKQHKTIHSDESKKTVRQSGGLKRHKLYHSGQKTHVSEQGFRFESNLRKHRLIQTCTDPSSNSSEDCSLVTNQGLGRTGVKLETGDNPGADGSCVKQEVENGNVSSTIPGCVLVKLEIDTYKDTESPQPTVDPPCNEFEKSGVCHC